MALSISQPFIHVEDATGNPHVGAKLYVYQENTTTLAAIYSDDALSVSLANPLISDAAGNFARAFIATGTYKLRVETAAGVLIWEYDHNDTALSAGTGALPINRGGTGGTTAAAARTNLDVPSNSEMAGLASDISELQASLQNISAFPQGYLTPTTGVPIITTGVSAGAAVYYAPFVGNLYPSWNGTSMVVREFSELTLTLNSNHVANNIHDCFLIHDNGTDRLVTGPAWNVSTAGSGSRGSGSGTTELTRVRGLLVNANAMTARNGGTTYSVDANKGTFVGSIWIDGTNGQITCHRSIGQSRKWSISNAYNRRLIVLEATDSTASWTYATNTWRASNNASANSVSTFNCLAEEWIDAELIQRVNDNTGSGGTSIGDIGLGLNSTSATTGIVGRTGSQTATFGIGRYDIIRAAHNLAPSIGANVITALENGNGSSNAATFLGTSSFMRLSARWMG